MEKGGRRRVEEKWEGRWMEKGGRRVGWRNAGERWKWEEKGGGRWMEGGGWRKVEGEKWK